MNQDYRLVFVEHRALDGAGIYTTARQRNPWSYETMSPKAFKSAVLRDLQKVEGGMDGLYCAGEHYRSEHLDQIQEVK